MTFKLVLTTANSIIGVSILAMPYCYQQCGIILTTVMIMCSALLVRMCCHLLVRGAYLSRSRTYELLALHSYGAPGKFAIEFCMIGFLLGTCVAFFVVIGDLMPPFAADILGIPDQPEVKERLRLWVMTGIGIFCALPLSLLRSLDSLSYIATASIAFYTGVTVYIGLTSSENLSAGEWVNQVNWWRPAGIFHTLPILCMALSCQPQVFEVRQALVEITRQPLGEASVSKMNKITSRAVNLCASVYTIVGISGYIALYNGDLGGNVLTAYTATLSIKIIKIGFGLSVALSFPLVIFPCRTAIHSLIFRKTGYSAPLDMPTTANYIPSTRSNAITLGVILVTLIIGINTPDIEKVLGMVGSTIGNCVCILMPAAFFLKITQNEKDTTERLGAKLVFVIGLMLMSVGTYVNLQDHNEVQSPAVKILANPKPLGDVFYDKKEVPVDNQVPLIAKPKVEETVKDEIGVKKKGEERIEPVEPHAPEDDKKSDDKKKDTEEKKEEVDDKREAQLKAKEEKADKLLEELEKQKEEHKQIIEEQKEVLDKMKQHLDEEKDTNKVIEAQVSKTKLNQSEVQPDTNKVAPGQVQSQQGQQWNGQVQSPQIVEPKNPVQSSQNEVKPPAAPQIQQNNWNGHRQQNQMNMGQNQLNLGQNQLNLGENNQVPVENQWNNANQPPQLIQNQAQWMNQYQQQPPAAINQQVQNQAQLGLNQPQLNMQNQPKQGLNQAQWNMPNQQQQIQPQLINKPLLPNQQPQQVPNQQPQQVPNLQPQQVPNLQPQQVPNLKPQQVPNQAQWNIPNQQNNFQNQQPPQHNQAPLANLNIEQGHNQQGQNLAQNQGKFENSNQIGSLQRPNQGQFQNQGQPQNLGQDQVPPLQNQGHNIQTKDVKSQSNNAQIKKDVAQNAEYHVEAKWNQKKGEWKVQADEKKDLKEVKKDFKRDTAYAVGGRDLEGLLK